MNKTKVWIMIIGSGLIAALTAAVSFFPEATLLLSSISGLVGAIVAYVNGANNK